MPYTFNNYSSHSQNLLLLVAIIIVIVLLIVSIYRICETTINYNIPNPYSVIGFSATLNVPDNTNTGTSTSTTPLQQQQLQQQQPQQISNTIPTQNTYNTTTIPTTTAQTTVTVPNVVGSSVGNATNTIFTAGLDYLINPPIAILSDLNNTQVTSQIPAAGTKVAPHTVINLYRSTSTTAATNTTTNTTTATSNTPTATRFIRKNF